MQNPTQHMNTTIEAESEKLLTRIVEIYRTRLREDKRV